MTVDRLSTTFAALADPTRRAMLARIAAGETSLTELARPLSMSLPGAAKHLKVLERAGLVSRGRDAQYRPCRLRAGPLRGVDEWLSHYRTFWQDGLDQLETYVSALQAKEKRHGRKK
jgi:DNA-binding transcriptional ArsR family regulator